MKKPIVGVKIWMIFSPIFFHLIVINIIKNTEKEEEEEGFRGVCILLTSIKTKGKKLS